MLPWNCYPSTRVGVHELWREASLYHVLPRFCLIPPLFSIKILTSTISYHMLYDMMCTSSAGPNSLCGACCPWTPRASCETIVGRYINLMRRGALAGLSRGLKIANSQKGGER